ncbi:MAG: type II secretion system major pseudopilin GspG [Sedimentisphaerales bacterium]|jgi:general secretion pathway protein G|nr:type II secretion system major pseudopilin GspG [Sedimentisphaerales bacterium]
MRHKKYRKLAGFTMIELMAVLIILGLLFAVVARSYVGHTDRARVITTMANLKQLHQAVQQFKMDTGRYPTEEEGLRALIEQPPDVQGWQPGGYLETSKLPADGWGREFIYQLYPESGKPFVIKSLGADGQEGGEGYDADLLSTDAVVPQEAPSR